MFTVDYFIKKFKAIPDCKWVTGDWDAGCGQHCAMGHCGADSMGHMPDEGKALNELFRVHLSTSPISVNDAFGENYLPIGESPKERILNALYEIKENTRLAKGIEPEVKHIHHYHAVEVPSTLVEQTEQIVLS